MEAILSLIQNFLKKTWAFLGIAKNNFWVLLSVPHLVDNYAKFVDGRGRNLMCHRTLPSRLVFFIQKVVMMGSKIKYHEIPLVSTHNLILLSIEFVSLKENPVFSLDPILKKKWQGMYESPKTQHLLSYTASFEVI